MNLYNKNENLEIDSDDIIIKNTSFTQLIKWWSNIKTHNLIYDQYENIILKTSQYALGKILLITSRIAWFISILAFLLAVLSKDISGMIFLLPFSIIFILWGRFLFYYITQSFIFDFQNWYFYDLRRQKNFYKYWQQEQYRKKIIPLNEIHALQIINEQVEYTSNEEDEDGYTRSYSVNFKSYELNLILKDSSRINILDHNNLDEIRNNAEIIANKLWVKIYDITQFYTENFY